MTTPYVCNVPQYDFNVDPPPESEYAKCRVCKLAWHICCCKRYQPRLR